LVLGSPPGNRARKMMNVPMLLGCCHILGLGPGHYYTLPNFLGFCAAVGGKVLRPPPSFSPFWDY